MALRLYGSVDALSGVEFLVRADDEADAQEALLLLKQETEKEFPLNEDHFSPPVLIQGSLTASGFDEAGTVNGRHITIPYEVLNLPLITSSVSTPNASENTFTNDFTIIFWLDLPDYDAGNVEFIVAKDGEGTTSGWYVFVDDNTVGFSASNGTTVEILESNNLAQAGFTKGWMRVTFFQTGRTEFYFSKQSKFDAHSSLAWIGLGAAQMPTVTSVISPAVDLRVGAQDGSNSAVGDLYRVMGMDSTDPKVQPAFDMFPDKDYVSGTTFTSSLSEGQETWTLEDFATIQARL